MRRLLREKYITFFLPVISVDDNTCQVGTRIVDLARLLEERKLSSVHLKNLLQSFYGSRQQRYLDRLPTSLRDSIDNQLQLSIASCQTSSDGTIKWLLSLADGARIETVLIPEANRYTLCVSSQVGCAFGCTFCATGKAGFTRHLHCREILEQVVIANNYLLNDSHRVTNIVFMGMGEPLHNIDAVLDACDILCHDSAFGLSRYRVTISTVGLVPAIHQLIGRTDVSLALSLHSPDDDQRREILPIARKYSIADTLSAVCSYLDSLSDNRKVFIEYTLISEYNDSSDTAHKLAQLLHCLPCKINLIPCNSVSGSSMMTSDVSRINNFLQILRSYGHTVMIRQTRGDDINAACGQLARSAQH